MERDGRAQVAATRGPRPGRSLTGRASLNAIASALDYGVRALVELVVSPMLVGGLGASVYGAWRVLWQWSGYIWGASGRSAQALQYAIANRQWTASDHEKRQLVGAALVVWALFLPIMAVVGLLGVWLGPTLLDIPSEYTESFRLAALILLVDAIVVTLVTMPRSVLQGENLGYARMGISTLLVLVTGALMVVAVRWEKGLPGLATAMLITSLLTGAIFLLITRRRLPWFGLSRPSRRLVQWFLGLSAWFLGWKFVIELMVASDVLVLAAFVPLSVVAAFALTKFVADSLTQALSLLVQATIPGIGGHLGAGHLRKAASLRGEVMSLVWLVGTAIGSTVIMWNAAFVRLWVGDELFAGTTTTLLVVVLAFQLAVIRADTFIIDVALMPRVKVLAGVAAALASIALAALAVGPLEGGVVGLCLGLVAGRSVLGVTAPLAVGRILGVSPVAQVRAAVRPVLVTSLVFAVCYRTASDVTVDSWLGLLTGVALSAPAVAAAALFAGLTRAQRGRLVRRVVGLIRRRQGIRS